MYKEGGIRNILKLSTLLKMRDKTNLNLEGIVNHFVLEQNEGFSLISVKYLFVFFPF